MASQFHSDQHQYASQPLEKKDIQSSNQPAEKKEAPSTSQDVGEMSKSEKEGWLSRLLRVRSIDPGHESHSTMLSDKDTVYELQSKNDTFYGF